MRLSALLLVFVLAWTSGFFIGRSETGDRIIAAIHRSLR